MKKTKVKKIKGVPEYNLGTWMTNGLKKLGGDNGLIGGVGKTSSALGVGSQVIGGALGIQQTGAAKFGNAIGDITSNFGPAGQIAGGIIKTLSNTMGGKGSVNQDTGEVTKPTGWMGALFGRSKHDLYTEANMIKNSATASKLTEGMRADYFNNAQNAPILAADGGVIPNTLAYLDDGELGKTPDGTIFEVPEEGKPTDSNLVNIPKGSKILSDKVKMKGTNKTYAEVGKHLMKNKKRIGKYAEGTEQANQMMFDKLVNMLELQKLQEEAVKMSKGGCIPKYGDGTDGENRDEDLADPDAINDAINGYNGAKAFAGQYKPNVYTERRTVDEQNITTPLNENELNYLKENLYRSGLIQRPLLWLTLYEPYTTPLNNFTYNYSDPVKPPKKGSEKTKLSEDAKNTKFVLNGKEIDISKPIRDGKPGEYSTEIQFLNGKPVTQHTYTLSERSKKLLNDAKILSGIKTENPMSKALRTQTVKNLKIKTPGFNDKPEHKDNNFNFADLALLAPSIAGMFPGKAERAVPYTTNAVYGPTQYNINPQLRAYDDSFAVANYNTRNSYPSTGMSLAAGLLNAVNLNNAYAQAYGTKNNAENQLGFQNANIANSTNLYNAQARHLAAVENAQNGAARRNIIRSAERDLATSIAGMRKDDRGFTMNQAMWAAMSPYMQYGMTNANYNNMNQYMTKAIR